MSKLTVGRVVDLGTERPESTLGKRLREANEQNVRKIAPDPARFRMMVSKDLYADHSGRVHLPKWKWTLVRPVSGETRALSPGYFESEAEATKNAWGFTLFMADAVRPLEIEVLR